MKTQHSIFLKQICLLVLLFTASCVYAQQLGKPLYVIDGLEVSSNLLSAIQVNYIKKIEVLKGKDASDLYGDKAKNGVVLITLKSEEELETEIPTIGIKVTNLLKKDGFDDDVKVVYWLDSKELSSNEATEILEKKSKGYDVTIKKEEIAHVTIKKIIYIR